MKVYEFRYSSDCDESAPSTLSIHHTLKGAANAMEAHMRKTKAEWENLFEGEDEIIKTGGWDFDQSWGVVETEVLP